MTITNQAGYNESYYPGISAADRPYSIAYDGNQRSRERYDVRVGDHYENDQPTAERAELGDTGSTPFGVDEWTSMWVIPRGLLTDTRDDRFSVIWQYRYVKNASGDDSGLSPDLGFYVQSGGRIYLQARSDGGTPVYVAGGLGEPEGIISNRVWAGTYTPGVPFRIVTRSVFSKTGGGSVRVWVNGALVYSGSAPLGYNRLVGPRFRRGNYKYSKDPLVVDLQHVEHGPRDLGSRVLNPLPI